MTQTITIPILPGFNPDSSILCVGDDSTIATSTCITAPVSEPYFSHPL